jgi:hypothetical protein
MLLISSDFNFFCSLLNLIAVAMLQKRQGEDIHRDEETDEVETVMQLLSH